VILILFKYLSKPKQLVLCSQVCKKWNKVSDTLWKNFVGKLHLNFVDPKEEEEEEEEKHHVDESPYLIYNNSVSQNVEFIQTLEKKINTFPRKLHNKVLNIQVTNHPRRVDQAYFKLYPPLSVVHFTDWQRFELETQGSGIDFAMFPYWPKNNSPLNPFVTLFLLANTCVNCLNQNSLLFDLLFVEVSVCE